jgi:tetratricopeptide (TPR) repeat protein
LEPNEAIRKGIECYQQGDYSAALEQFTASGVDPYDNYELMFFMGLAYERLEQHDKAVELLDSVQHLDDNFWRKMQSQLALAYIYACTQRFDEADSLLEKLTNAGIEQATVYSLWGYVSEKRHDENAAVRRYKKAIELDPENSNALNSLGYLYACSTSSGSYDEALLYLRRAVSLAPQNPAYLDSLGWLCHKMGKNDEAEDYLSRALSYAGDNPTIKEHLETVKKNEDNR